MNQTTDYVLYILMRSDMDSLNPGKAMAQAAHAAHMIEYDMLTAPEDIREQYTIWKQQAGGFGTTIVLECPDREIMDNILCAAIKSDYCTVGSVEDPTYPVRDGSVTHLIPVITCGYIFADKTDEQIRGLLSVLQLHP